MKKILSFLGGAFIFVLLGILGVVVLGWFFATNENMSLWQKIILTFTVSCTEATIATMLYDFIKRDLFFIEHYKQTLEQRSSSLLLRLAHRIILFDTKTNILISGIIHCFVINIIGPFFGTLLYRKDEPYAFCGIKSYSTKKYILGNSLIMLPWRMLNITATIKIFYFAEKIILQFI